MVKEEVDQLTAAGFIYPVLSSEWVSPIVCVPKKPYPDGTIKIRVCQDYRKLNAATRKDHFPLPFIDMVLDQVSGYDCYSFLDGYSGYNQVIIREQDRDKTTFTTDWGTFAYNVMPFGLCNAPATFQRIMMIIFQEFLRKFLEVFMDDFCVYSPEAEHFSHLIQTFEKCRQTGLRLHPWKSYFGMTKGILLGHVISKKGIELDVDKVKVIAALKAPTDVREIRAFLGHAGYYRRAIHKYAEIAMPLTALLKKDIEFEWNDTRQQAFEDLKQRLISAPVLIKPDWEKDFHVFIDASAYCIGANLSQKNADGRDYPIYYSSRQMNAAEKNYSVTNREALAIVFAFKKYRHYLLGYKTIFHTDHSSLKYLVNQPDLSGRVARWVLLFQEFDYEVQVRPGKHHENADFLSRLPGPTPDKPLNDDFPDEHIWHIEGEDSLYYDIVQMLTLGIFPDGLSPEARAVFLHKVGPYTLINGVLHKLSPDQKLKRCLELREIPRVLDAMHSGLSGGHYAANVTIRKIQDAGYWWPTMHKDAYHFIQHCDPCQRLGRPSNKHKWPLIPILPLAPFEKWGIDFIGPVQPVAKRSRSRYIILATEYVTKWVEAEATRLNDAQTAARFLFTRIITRFGCPLELVSDRGLHFLNSTVKYLTEHYLIKHRKTTPYNPKCNGLTERANGIMGKILNRVVSVHKTDWDEKLYSALWAYRTAFKVTHNRTPFYLAFGLDSVVPIEFDILTYRTFELQRMSVEESMLERMKQLDQLEEDRYLALEHTKKIQDRRKKYFDKKLHTPQYKVGDFVLLFDNRFFKFPGKLHTHWPGPYRIEKDWPNGSFSLKTLAGEPLPTRVNAWRMKPYKFPIVID
jgi:transposase InsO family protein